MLLITSYSDTTNRLFVCVWGLFSDVFFHRPFIEHVNTRKEIKQHTDGGIRPVCLCTPRVLRLYYKILSLYFQTLRLYFGIIRLYYEIRLHYGLRLYSKIL